MGLVDQWTELEAQLPGGWSEARLVLRLERAADAEAAVALLAPLQPLATGPQDVSIRVARDGSGPGVESLRRGLERLDGGRLGGRLALAETQESTPPAQTAFVDLAAGWQSELAAVPADWSDLLAEVELDSSDFLDRAAVHLAPINPRRTGELTTLRFRSARLFGYGAAPGMVAACLRRCDRDAIRGRVRILRVLSDTRPVGTQGPVWQIDGETV